MSKILNISIICRVVEHLFSAFYFLRGTKGWTIAKKKIIPARFLQKKSCVQCCGLPVHLLYIVITCAHIDSIKRFVVNRHVVRVRSWISYKSVHDNFGDKDGILWDILLRKK